ncbi:hypothetical protein FQN54_001113 [Arachnomyces sp. PD_36]|nr:hypothetical protein FQN54_001113 [Arachnomyces sp. PD_36]
MRVRRETAILPLLTLLPSLSSAVTFDCEQVLVEGKKFNFGALGGPHSVTNIVDHPPGIINTTYTLDICKPLRRTKGVNRDYECPNYTRVCGIERTINEEEDTDIVSGTIPIAGNYDADSGEPLDPKITRLKSTDVEAEGIRLELHGGRFPFKSGGVKQQAVIEFRCDPERTGLEKSGDKDASERAISAAEDGDEGGDEGGDDTEDENSLRFKSYGLVDDVGVLRLDWLTKYACEDFEEDDGDANSSSHWGFFTWLIIIVFLATAAYLIFGSWLNYNRYGARGWDLLPHGDTIRDIPYIMQDWIRRVINTVQGPGGRGGYSAV